VVVLAPDVEGIVSLPSKGDPVLIVHPDGVAPNLIPLEGMQVIAGGNLQVVDRRHQIELLQLALGRLPRGVRDASRCLAIDAPEQLPRGLVREGPDHTPIIHDTRVS
jgi:hypothetical protein